MDIESLERQNDEGIAALGERVGLLRNVSSPACRAVATSTPHVSRFTVHGKKNLLYINVQVTSGIHGEVQNHHTILDRMVRRGTVPLPFLCHLSNACAPVEEPTLGSRNDIKNFKTSH